MQTSTLVRAWAGAAAGLALAACVTDAPSVTASSQAPIDCPLRDAPYSLQSPLMDIVQKPEAVEALNALSPGFSVRIPAPLRSAQTPNFGAILSLEIVAPVALPNTDLAAADAVLRALPVTDADRVARCARYDAEPVNLAFPRTGVRVLLFEKINGFRDGPSVDAARAAFTGLAERNNWTLRTTDRGGAITDANLRNVDVLIWNNVSGDVLTLTQRAALQRYIERGGGFVAIHGSGGDPSYFWDWYADELIGARFIGHPMDPQFHDARIIVQGESAIGRDLAPGWTMNDEWYSFASNPGDTGATIIASLDESTYEPGFASGRDLRMGEHPIVWTRCVGAGRSFYSAIGHRPEAYSDTNHLRLLEQGITWAAGLGETTCRDGQEVPRR